MSYLYGMAQTREGNKKVFCKRHGISIEEYEKRVSEGQKHCTKCKQWLPISMFKKDNSRYDGLKASCSSKGCGRVLIPKTLKGRISPFKGMKHNAESLALMSEKSKGNKNRLGKAHSKESKDKIRGTRKERGYYRERCYQWKGGVAVAKFKERAMPEYDQWRRSVFERDLFTCRYCGDKVGGNLEVHHLNGFSAFPEQRLLVENGATLCRLCHRAFHLEFGYSNNIEKQFIIWLKARKLSGQQLSALTEP